MRLRSVAAITAAVWLSGCGHHAVGTQNAAATATNAGGQVVARAGTVYYGKLDKTIGTKVSHDGDTFTIEHTDTFLHKDPALNGAAIDARVENVRAAGPMRNPRNDDRLRRHPAAGWNQGAGQRDDRFLEAVRSQDASSADDRNDGRGRDRRMTHRRHGALLGAASGYALSQTLKTDVEVPAGTVVELRLNQPVTKSNSG
jgi:hypothetical protein